MFCSLWGRQTITFSNPLHLSDPRISGPEAGFDRLVPAANKNRGITIKHSARTIDNPRKYKNPLHTTNKIWRASHLISRTQRNIKHPNKLHRFRPNNSVGLLDLHLEVTTFPGLQYYTTMANLAAKQANTSNILVRNLIIKPSKSSKPRSICSDRSLVDTSNHWRPSSAFKVIYDGYQ